MKPIWIAAALAVSLTFSQAAASAELIKPNELPAILDQDRFDMAMRFQTRTGEDTLILPNMPRAEPYDAIICNTSTRPGVFMTELRYKPGAPIGNYKIGARSCVPLYRISALQANNSTDGDWTGVVFLRKHEP